MNRFNPLSRAGNPATRHARGVTIAMVLVAWFALGPPAVRANVVADWDAIAAATITPPPGTVLPAAVTEAEQRPIFQVDLASVHIAIYDAVNAIDRRHEPFAIAPKSKSKGASAEAAVVGAAYGVLKGLFPGRAVLYQSFYDSYMSGAAGDAAKARGLALGAEVAAGVLDLRRNDGRLTPFTYVTTGEPGDFVPGPTPLVNGFLPFVKPFAIRRASQFRAPGPPALASEKYADDLNEVQSVGSVASVLRTPDQTDLAKFYTDPPPLYTPRNYRRFATDSQSSTLR